MRGIPRISEEREGGKVSLLKVGGEKLERGIDGSGRKSTRREEKKCVGKSPKKGKSSEAQPGRKRRLTEEKVQGCERSR